MPIVASVTNRSPRLASGAAAVLVAIALVDAAKQVPTALQTAHARVRADARLSILQRELAPARRWRMNERLLLRAVQIMPRDAVYSIAVGRQEASRGVPLFYAYWLLPRRRTADPRAAAWVILWGKERSELGVETKVVADLGGDAQVLRVRP